MAGEVEELWSGVERDGGEERGGEHDWSLFSMPSEVGHASSAHHGTATIL